MISYRKFFSICLMMAVLFFMFQFLQLYKEMGNEYSTNQYMEGERLSGEGRWQAKEGEGEYVLFVGKEGSDAQRVASQWCLYTKRRLTLCPALDEKLLEEGELPRLVLLEGDGADFGTQTEQIAEMARKGVPIVFLNLPSFSVIEENAGLRELLGIERAQEEEVKLLGVQLFSGFLLGGESLYAAQNEEEEEKQDLALSVPWYVTGKGTKTYMRGVIEEEGVDREEYPALIWRNTFEGAFIFAVNGDYMSDVTGLGLLSAIEYEASSVTLYPVVNAQNVTVTGYPGFAEENAEVMETLYSRRSSSLQQDIIWPGMSALFRRSGLKGTFFLMPQYDYGDGQEPETESYAFYLQQMKEIDGEAGKTLEHGEGITLEEKQKRDSAFWEKVENGYQFGAYYTGEGIPEELQRLAETGALEDAVTLAYTAGEEADFLLPPVAYYSDDLTAQRITVNGAQDTYSQSLRHKSLMTALGYSNLLIDMQSVLRPDSEEDRWENFYEEISGSLNRYSLQGFSATTLSESDERVRCFLNLSYAWERTEDVIVLETGQEADKAWFLLRTHGEEITEISGADYQKLEEDAFLIQMLSDRARIELGKSKEELSFGL